MATSLQRPKKEVQILKLRSNTCHMVKIGAVDPEFFLLKGLFNKRKRN